MPQNKVNFILKVILSTAVLKSSLHISISDISKETKSSPDSTDDAQDLILPKLSNGTWSSLTTPDEQVEGVWDINSWSGNK